MGRRGGYQTFRCHTEGCRESATVEYSTLRERAETAKSTYYSNWKCTRHRSPEKLLTPGGGAVQAVLVCYEESYGRFWRPEGSTKGGNGFDFSTAHNAYADDFPVGTRLVITAYVETPDQAALSED
jgi:hypothetical protein